MLSAVPRHLALLLALTGLHSPAGLAAVPTPPDQVRLIVDPAISEFGGRTSPLDWEDASAIPADDPALARVALTSGQRYSNQHMDVPLPPATSNGQIAANALGSALGNLIISSVIDSSRQKALARLSGSFAPGEPRESFLDALKQAAGQHGMPVQDTRLADPNEKLVGAEFAAGDARYVLTVERIAKPMVSVSLDDRRLVLLASLSLYERQADKPRLLGRSQLAYLGNFASGPDAQTYWSAEQAAPFRAQMSLAGAQMLDAFLDQLPGFARADAVPASGITPGLAARSRDGSHALFKSADNVLLVMPVLPVFPPSAVAQMFAPTAPALAAATSADTAPATLVVTGLNDSDAETSLRRFMFMAYRQDNCTGTSRIKLAGNYINPKRETSVSSEVLSLPAGAPVWLNLTFLGLNFGLTRICSATVQFLPQAGRHYRAELAVDRALSHCEGRLVELDAEGQAHEAPFTLPPLLCGTKDQPNGGRQWFRH